MSLLQNVLCGVALSTGVVGVLAVSAPPARADVFFPGYGPFATLAIAETKRMELGNSNLRSQYFQNGPAGAGWYLVY